VGRTQCYSSRCIFGSCRQLRAGLNFPFEITHSELARNIDQNSGGTIHHPVLLAILPSAACIAPALQRPTFEAPSLHSLTELLMLVDTDYRINTSSPTR
jgi:hypothetical protein